MQSRASAGHLVNGSPQRFDCPLRVARDGLSQPEDDSRGAGLGVAGDLSRVGGDAGDVHRHAGVGGGERRYSVSIGEDGYAELEEVSQEHWPEGVALS